MPPPAADEFDKADLLQSKMNNMPRARKSIPSTSLTRQLSPAHQIALIGSFIATTKSNEEPADLITGTWNSWTRHESTKAHFDRRHKNIPAATLASGKTPYHSLVRSKSHIPIKVNKANDTPTIPEIISSTATSLSAKFFTAKSWFAQNITRHRTLGFSGATPLKLRRRKYHAIAASAASHCPASR